MFVSNFCSDFADHAHTQSKNDSVEKKEDRKSSAINRMSPLSLSLAHSFTLFEVIPVHMSIDRIDKKSGIFNHVSHSKNLFTRVLHKN